MGRSRNENAAEAKKSQLVMDICNISLRASSCAHNKQHFRPEKSKFIDWYLILGIEESDGVDVVKKSYRRLALQLHPDKNKHPKAEMAFKLVSQAYVCLVDNTRRATFDQQRQNNFCKDCCRNPHLMNFNNSPRRAKSSGNVLQILKELRSRFLDEAKVIENCLKINNNISNVTTTIKESRGCKNNLRKCDEYPVFNPSNYVLQGYPHHRNQGRVVNKKWQSPVYEHRSERIKQNQNVFVVNT